MVPPLNIEWTRSNEYEVHHTNMSQQYTTFHSNRLKSLRDNWCTPVTLNQDPRAAVLVSIIFPSLSQIHTINVRLHANV